MNRIPHIHHELSQVSSLPAWGAVQNNADDANLNIFSIDTYAELQRQLQSVPKDKHGYITRRWFLYMASELDKELFLEIPGVNPCLNKYSKDCDVYIGSTPMDIKSTVIPKSFSQTDFLHAVFTDNKKDIYKWFFDNQSKGIRNHTQNRLFIIHTSSDLEKRIDVETKRVVYKHFVDNQTFDEVEINGSVVLCQLLLV